MKRPMRNYERTEIDDVCDSKGDSSCVCLSCTGEDCVSPAEMTEQTRPVMTHSAGDRLRRQPLQRCVLLLLQSVRLCVCVRVLLLMIHAE